LSFELEPAAMRFTVEFSVCGTEGYATYNADDDVEIGGQSIPRKILFQSGGGQLPWLRMGIEVRNDVPECTYLELDSNDGCSEVRSKHLKGIRVEEWVTQIVATCAKTVERTTKAGRRITRLAHGPATPAQVKAVERMQRRRRDPNDRQLLEQVAALYKGNPDAPIVAIGETLGMTPRTAARWAARCSEVGLLPKVSKKGQKRL